MRVRHPDASEGERVHVDGDVAIVEDGVFELPERATGWLNRWCDANGYDPDEVVLEDADDSEETAETAESDASDDSSDDETCGYYDAETMDSPCSRPAGWGRDADDGPCRDHVES